MCLRRFEKNFSGQLNSNFTGPMYKVIIREVWKKKTFTTFVNCKKVRSNATYAESFCFLNFSIYPECQTFGTYKHDGED